MAGLHALDGASPVEIFEARRKVPLEVVAEFRSLGEFYVRVLGENLDFAGEGSLVSPCHAVVPRVHRERPVAEIDFRLVSGEVDLRLLVDGRRESPADLFR